MVSPILRDASIPTTPHFLGTDGNIRGPAGDGRVAVVAQADIAEVTITVLTSDGAADGRTLNLAGRPP